MTLRAEYINAVERRLAWLKWIDTPAAKRALAEDGFAPAIPIYRAILDHSITFYMTPHFSQLVDHARRAVPNHMKFDSTWLQAKSGWIWLDDPFEVPHIVDVEQQRHTRFRALPSDWKPGVRAIGWEQITPGEHVYVFPGGHRDLGPAKAGSIQFACFENMQVVGEREGFGAWSYFVLRDGDELGSRIETFEQISNEAQKDGQYIVQNRSEQPLHEIRWIYTALHLMSQRLSITVRHPTDRATRHRAEREGQKAPPFIDVVTLRRLEAARRHDPQGNNVDWQWQWQVAGHWRDQWYPSEGVHKPKFIESYIKGPADKPLKPDSIKVYVAER